MINKADLSMQASLLRRRLGEDNASPIDVFVLAFSIENLSLVFYPMGKSLSGICIKNQGIPVIAINSAMSLGRQRFSLAHELYHLYFDENPGSSICIQRIGEGGEAEKEADIFASYLLMPAVGLEEIIHKLCGGSKVKLGIREIVSIEQHFGVSRQALLWRLINDKKLTAKEAEVFRQNVILSAVSLGYDKSLYRPLPESKRYGTYGYYIQKVGELLTKELISQGRYEQFLSEAFRADLVYGTDSEEDELND